MYVKSLDPNHMVTVGLEGFFGPSTPDLTAECNPYNQVGGQLDPRLGFSEAS
jgi:endo-1,4-beta-mannosidase